MSAAVTCAAQPFNTPLNQAFSFESEQLLIQNQSQSVSSFKPLLQSRINQKDSGSVPFPTIELNYRKNRSLLARKLFFEHLITIDTGIIRLTIDPLLNLELGDEQKDDPRSINLYKNSRGVNLQLGIGKQVAIGSSFRENQANLPFYVNERTKETQMAFGQGRVKTFNEVGFDFSMSSAYISYSPSSNINIQAGHGKHFLGEGHRSILLSDLSFNYPYLKFNTTWFNQKLHYQNVYALLQNMNRLPSSSGSEGLFERKQATFHYLEYKAGKKLSIGLFEGIIYPGIDSSGNQSNGIGYWVPIIFLNSLLEAPDENGNSLLGLNLAYTPFKNLKLYQQLSLFDEDKENIGFQSGFKWFPFKTFMIQAELNNLRDLSGINRFKHNNESLHHPFPSDALEALGIVQYQKNRWQTRGAIHLFEVESRDILFLDFRQTFVVNPSYQLGLHAGVQYREEDFAENQSGQSENLYLYLGLSTNLQNLYFNY